RLKRLGRALPGVTRSLVSAKPSAFNFCSIRCARRRLKTNSATLRALIAPSDSAVCPTSTTMRNFDGSQLVAAGFKAAGLKATGPKAASFKPASFAARGFGEASCFAELTCFEDLSCLGDLPCFGEPLMAYNSRPALLLSLGRSTNAAIEALIVQWRGQTPTFAKV